MNKYEYSLLARYLKSTFQKIGVSVFGIFSCQTFNPTRQQHKARSTPPSPDQSCRQIQLPVPKPLTHHNPPWQHEWRNGFVPTKLATTNHLFAVVVAVVATIQNYCKEDKEQEEQDLNTRRRDPPHPVQPPPPHPTLRLPPACTC